MCFMKASQIHEGTEYKFHSVVVVLFPRHLPPFHPHIEADLSGKTSKESSKTLPRAFIRTSLTIRHESVRGHFTFLLPKNVLRVLKSLEASHLNGSELSQKRRYLSDSKCSRGHNLEFTHDYQACPMKKGLQMVLSFHTVAFHISHLDQPLTF